MTTLDLSLYLVLDHHLCADHGLIETVRDAVAGGVTVVQLRDKDGDTDAFLVQGRALLEVLAPVGVPLIINDNVDAAVSLDCAGLHVGQGDMPPAEARARIGPGKILGLSITDRRQIEDVDPDVVDYIGVGPVFATQTKPGHSPPTGLDGLREIVASSPVPVVAIGGLKEEHVSDLVDAGTDGIAVVSAICGQPDPRRAAARLAKRLKVACGAGRS